MNFFNFPKFDIEDGEICLWPEYKTCSLKSALSKDMPMEY